MSFHQRPRAAIPGAPVQDPRPGVFAARRIRKGTRIIEYVGERVSHEEADRRYEDRPIEDNHTFLFIVDRRTVIDAGVGGNAARYINHSCDRTARRSSRTAGSSSRRCARSSRARSCPTTTRSSARRANPPEIDEIFACRCGAAHCRGTMLLPQKRPRRKKAATRRARPSTMRMGVRPTGTEARVRGGRRCA